MGSELTGAWSGQYTYLGEVEPPVAFTAVLNDSDGPFTGTIEETDVLEGPLSASVDGRRAGSTVTFAKFYDTGSERFDTVWYEGRLNADNTEIEGVWRIPGALSGRFMMIRSEAQAVAAGRRETAKV